MADDRQKVCDAETDEDGNAVIDIGERPGMYDSSRNRDADQCADDDAEDDGPQPGDSDPLALSCQDLLPDAAKYLAEHGMSGLALAVEHAMLLLGCMVPEVAERLVSTEGLAPFELAVMSEELNTALCALQSIAQRSILLPEPTQNAISGAMRYCGTAPLQDGLRVALAALRKAATVGGSGGEIVRAEVGEALTSMPLSQARFPG